MSEDIFDFGVPKDTPDTVWILGIPLQKGDLDQLIKRGYSEDEAKEILITLVSKVKWVYRQAIMRVPKSKRENVEFRRGLFQGIYKGFSSKVTISSIFKPKVERIKAKINSLFLRSRNNEINKAVALALQNESQVAKLGKKALKKNESE